MIDCTLFSLRSLKKCEKARLSVLVDDLPRVRSRIAINPAAAATIAVFFLEAILSDAYLIHSRNMVLLTFEMDEARERASESIGKKSITLPVLYRITVFCLINGGDRHSQQLRGTTGSAPFKSYRDRRSRFRALVRRCGPFTTSLLVLF